MQETSICGLAMMKGTSKGPHWHVMLCWKLLPFWAELQKPPTRLLLTPATPPPPLIFIQTKFPFNCGIKIPVKAVTNSCVHWYNVPCHHWIIVPCQYWNKVISEHWNKLTCQDWNSPDMVITLLSNKKFLPFCKESWSQLNRHIDFLNCNCFF